MAVGEVTGRAIRLISVGQGAAGAGLAMWPRAVTAAFGIRDRHAPPVWLVRVLGARMAMQAGVQLARPTPAVVWSGVTVDAAHALSMVAVAARSRRYRRGALVSAAVAASSSLALALAARTEHA